MDVTTCEICGIYTPFSRNDKEQLCPGCARQKRKLLERYMEQGKYEKIATEIGKLVDEKNKAYGDAFNKSADFLKILYPEGVDPEQYGDMLAIVRIFDKLMRIATDKDAFGENPWKDLAGYGILMSED